MGSVMLRQGQKQLRFAKERPAGSLWLETSCSSCSEKSFCFCRSICGLLLLLPSNRISHSFNYCPTNQDLALKVSDRFEWDFCKRRFQRIDGMFCNVLLLCWFYELVLKKDPWVRDRLTVETCSWFSPYWLRGELTRWLSKVPPSNIEL